MFKGYNATVLAYGQTGSGKTFTMGTEALQSSDSGLSETVGVIPRAMEAIFDKVEQETACGKASYVLSVSFLEVYKEAVRDLLAGNGGGQPGQPLR